MGLIAGCSCTYFDDDLGRVGCFFGPTAGAGTCSKTPQAYLFPGVTVASIPARDGVLGVSAQGGACDETEGVSGNQLATGKACGVL